MSESHAPTRLCEEATSHGVSDDPPSGAMVTPLIAAIDAGDPGPPFETSPTTRVTGTLERMMAPVVNNRAASTVPDRC